MIVINTTFELEKKTGIGAYILTLLKGLQLNNKQYQVLELKLPQKLKFKYYWQFLWLNTVVYLKHLIEKPSIFISPSFIMPYLKNRNTKYITVIHDLAVFRENEVTKYVKNLYKLFINVAVKRADKIIVVSDAIKKELINYYNINPSRVKTVYNSIGEHFITSNTNQNILEKYNLDKNKYILSVATLNKRKNIPTLVKAFEQISDKYPDIKLVLVGGMGNEDRGKLTQHPNIIFTGYIKDEELPALYKNAFVYMYPSLYEGFGIPLIESQYCGCPVLCSDIPVFREIGSDSVEYCEPTVEGIAKGVESLISNTERLQELSILGKENVKRFSIEKIAEQLQGVINE